MRKTHELVIIDKNTININGNGNYFSWLLEYEFGKWELSTAYGKRQGTFNTIGKALRHIGFKIL